MKKWIISVAIVVIVLIVAVAAVGTMLNRGYGISTGRYLEATNGSSLLIRGNSPIRMSNGTERDLFRHLATGDKILVIHDGINESYPGSTGAYAVFRLSKGAAGDIPQEVADQLVALGWLEPSWAE